MKAVVTGGAGFIGSNLSIELMRMGYDITVVDDLSSGYRENIESFPSIKFVHGDIRSREILDKVMDGASIVFHLAASVGNKRSIDYPVNDSEVNVIGTLNVLESARNNSAKKIVASSSAGIYGELLTVPIREDHPLDPETPYACSKLGMEKLCLAYAKLYDMEAVCLRYFNVYGPNQRFDEYGNVIPIFAFQLLAGKQVTIFGDGNQTRDFVNVADVIQANIKAATAEGVTGAYNLASGTQISINDLYATICKCAAIDRQANYGPERPGDVQHSLADISRARNSFDYQPGVSIDEGLDEYLGWVRNELVGRS